MKKRVLSFVLILCMVLVQLPQQAFAAVSDGNGVVRAQEEEPVGEEEPAGEEEEPAGVNGEYGIAPVAEGDIVTYELENGAKLTFDKSTGTITGASLNEATEIEIPESIEGVLVTKLANYAFDYSALRSIVLPRTLETIGIDAFSHSNFERIIFPDDSELVSIDYGAFSYCSALTEINLPEGLESLGDSAFKECTALTSISLPEGLTTIEGGTFDWCRLLASVTLPGSLKEIKGNAFFGCIHLSEIVLPEGLTTIGNSVFSQCSGLEKIVIPDSVTSLGTNVFSYCSSLKTVKLSKGLTQIGSSLFLRCTSLQEVEIPDSVKEIGNNAFAHCWELPKITLPAGLTAIGANAFDTCTKLTSINIPETLETIGESAFSHCESLIQISLPEEMTAIGSHAFEECNSLGQIKIPAGITEIGENTFYNCGDLIYAELPEGLTSIGESAFSGCYKLVSVKIWSPDVIIAESALSGLNKRDSYEIVREDLIMYGYPGSTTQEYAEAHNYIFLSLLDDRSLEVRVQKPDGTLLQDGYTVNWYDENETLLPETGSVLTGATDGKKYFFEVQLNDALKEEYETPERQVIDPERSGVITVKLTAAKKLQLNGKVIDRGGNPVSAASITVKSLRTGNEITAETNEEGIFSLEVFHAMVLVTVRKDGYYRKESVINLAEQAEDEYTLADIVLSEVVTDRVVLNILQKQAAEDPSTAAERVAMTAEGLKISLMRNGTAFTEYEIQGLCLIFQPDVVEAGDAITITVADPTGEYVPSEPVTVTLDENKIGNADITLIQKGSFVLDELSGPEAALMVFDADGNCIHTGIAQAGISNEPLEAGKYEIVLLQKTSLLRGVPNLKYLDTLHMIPGVDYVRQSVVISDGCLIRLSGIEVPALDESKFSYVLPEKTFVRVMGSSNVLQGALFMIQVSYELDSSRGVEADRLHVVLPEGIQLAEKASAWVNGDIQQPVFDESTRTAEIDVSGVTEASVYLHCLAIKHFDDKRTISAYLEVSGGLAQSVGAADITVENITLEVPERTSVKEITVHGTTAPNSPVVLYDNDEEMVTIYANSAGSWSANLILKEPTYCYSYHFIQAVSNASQLSEPLFSEEKMVIYDERAVEFKSITMYNIDHSSNEQETVIDFSDKSTLRPYYLYNSFYPEFSFKVEVAEQNGLEITELFVVTENLSGDKTYVPMTYDAVSGEWTGSHKYENSNDVPERISLAYSFDGMWERPEDEELLEDLKKEYVDLYDVLADQFNELVEAEFDENTQTGSVFFNNPETNEKDKIADYFLDTAIIEDMTREWLMEKEFISLEEEGLNVWIKEGVDDQYLMLQAFADLETKELLVIIYDFNVPEEASISLFSGAQSDSAVSSYSGSWTDDDDIDIGEALSHFTGADGASVLLTILSNVPGIYGIIFSVVGIAHTAICFESSLSCYKKFIEGSSTSINDSLYNLATMILAKCKDTGQYRLSAGERQTLWGVWDSILQEQEEFIRYAELGKTDLNNNMQLSLLLAEGSLLASFIPAGIVASPLLGAAGTAVGLKESLIDAPRRERELNRRYSDMMRKIEDTNQKAVIWGKDSCDDDPQPAPGALETPARDLAAVHDPSGYVYEAVPSNRLEGVTATISSEAGGTWNAQDYDQVNPQVTGSEGEYYWNVPGGNWKVTFTKKGYEDADTSKVPQAENGWLPVPPPQLGINVGMIAEASPVVEVAVAYTDQAEVVFSQYMDIESVEKALALSRDNAAVKVKVVALDAEDNADGTKQYATRFALIPEDGDLSGALQVTVDGTACNYAGKPIEEPYASGELKAMQRPVDIEVAEEIYVVLHENSKLPLTLLPGVAGQKLVVENLTPSLISLAAEEVTTGEAGKAEISLEGLLLGSGMLKISEPISGLCKTVKVNIVLTLPEVTKPQPVVATLEDGTVLESGMSVPYGARITLTTPTQGAVIRYTVNDTCPCKEAALTYSGPIEVEESMVQNGQLILRAAACQDGTYSETIRLVLSVAKKENVKIDGVAAAEGLIYNGKAQTGYTGTPSSAYQGEYVISYAGKGDTIYGPSSAAPVHAGEYTVTISVPEDQEAYSGSVTLEFAIQKAQITIDADDKEAFVGDAEPVYTYTITGLAVADRLKTEPVLKCEADMTQKGVYLIIPGGAEVPNEEDYLAEIIYVNGLLKLDRKQQPTEPEPSQSPSEQPPAETESSQSPSEQPPAETESSQSPSEQPPAETESSQSPSEQPPAETESSQSPSEQPPAETESSQSPSEQLPAETESSQSPSEQSPAETESSQSPSEQLPAETEASQSPSEQAPAETEASSVAPKTDDSGSVELFILFFLCGLYAAAAASANLRKSRKERR